MFDRTSATAIISLAGSIASRLVNVRNVWNRQNGQYESVHHVVQAFRKRVSCIKFGATVRYSTSILGLFIKVNTRNELRPAQVRTSGAPVRAVHVRCYLIG